MMWLNRNSFTGDGFKKPVRVSLPATFGVELLAPYITSVTEGWLTTIVGTERVATLHAYLFDAPEAVDESGLYGIAEPFLVYAVWSAYILENNLTATRTGLVTKDQENSEPISDAQRSQLSKHYKDTAERFALRLSEFVAVPGNCSAPALTATKIKIGKATGPGRERI